MKKDIENTEQKIDNPKGIPLKKYSHTLNLLDTEYFGREQEIYLLLFNNTIKMTQENKNICKSNNQIIDIVPPQ